MTTTPATGELGMIAKHEERVFYLVGIFGDQTCLTYKYDFAGIESGDL
jgi:hypothetical protein